MVLTIVFDPIWEAKPRTIDSSKILMNSIVSNWELKSGYYESITLDGITVTNVTDLKSLLLITN